MSAFLLYFHAGDSFDQTAQKAISAALIHYPSTTTDMYARDNLQLIYTVNKNDRIRIFQHPAAGLIFFLQGHIYESAKGIERIDNDKAGCSVEEQIIKRYLTGGISSCTGLNGLYNLCAWNEKQRILEIAGDRLGIFQVFHAPIGNNRHVFTSDIAALKAIPGYRPKLNRRGLFDLLFMGVAYEDRTVLEDVHRLLPNASYRVDNGRLSLLEMARLPFSRERWGRVTPKLLDELEHFYVQAIRRRLKPQEKILFMQSGGKDSRVYSSFLKKSGIVPDCITAGEDHHGEVFFSKNVNKYLGFPWKRMPVSQDFNLSFANDYVEIDSFSSRLFSLWQMEVISEMAAGYDVVTATFLGDPIFGSTLSKGKLEKSEDPFRVFSSNMNAWRTSLYSDEELMRLFPDEAKEWIASYQKEAFDLFRSLGDEPYQMIAAYGARSNDRFKVGAVIKTLSAVLPVRLPCIDNDLMDFAFSLPPSMLYKRLLLDLYLTQREDTLAAIPLDENNEKYTALTRSFRSELKFKLWRAYARKIKIPVLHFTDPVNATTQFYVSVFSLRDRGFMALRKKTRNSLACLDGIMNVDMANELFDEMIPSGKDHIMPGNRIRTLLTVLLAAETFNR